MADTEHVQTKLPGESMDSVTEFAEDHRTTEYVAVRKLIHSGLNAEGYGPGGQTTAKKVAGEGMRFSAYSAAVLIGVDLTTPLPLSSVIVAFLVAALVLSGVWHAEPTLTDGLKARVQARKTPMSDGGGVDGE